MLLRLRYAALLLASVLAIVIGLWPSLLTLGALLAIPLVVLALAGLFRPLFVEARQRLRRFVRLGGSVIAAELVIVFAVIAWTPRRPVLLVAESPVPSRVRVIFGVDDGAPRSWLRWGRRFDVPAGGVVYSQYPRDQGWYREENPHPVQAVVTTASGHFHSVRVAWVRGGTTQAGACTLAFDEFALGDTARALEEVSDGFQPVGWLDSLSTWGVECRQGRLHRVPPERASALHRTGPASYYNRAGTMACSSSTGAP